MLEVRDDDAAQKFKMAVPESALAFTRVFLGQTVMWGERCVLELVVITETKCPREQHHKKRQSTCLKVLAAHRSGHRQAIDSQIDSLA